MRGHGIEDIYRLSPMQQGMLFHEMAEPEAGLYLLHRVYELEGPLDQEELIAAWRRAVERHPVLRTSFHWKEVDEPVQVVHEHADVAVDRESWADVPDAELDERARRFDERQQRPFDLQEAPLMRLGLVRLGENRHRLTWTFHHILMEGWSAAIVMDEVLRDYEAAREGREADLPSRRPFRDYLTWMGSRDVAEAESFWRETLSGVGAPSKLLREVRAGPGTVEAEKAGPTVWDHREVSSRLSVSDTLALKEFGAAHGLTLNTIVQGAWGLLLSRYTDTRDALFGATVSGRSADLDDIENMVGLFINTIPTRLRVDSGLPVADWLREVQRDQVRARAFEWCSLVDVHGWSEVPRQVPLFESIVVFSNWLGSGADEWEGSLEVRAVGSAEGGTGYPLTLMVAPGRELGLTLGFDGRATDEEQVQRILRSLVAILEDVAADPQRTVGAISMTSAEERRAILARNDTDVAHDGSAPTYRLVEERSAAHPDRVAVSSGPRTVRYGELAEGVRRLSDFLRDRGVAPGSVVAVCMGRSEDVIVALLAVMRTGAAYLPVDPALPASRVGFMLDDAGVRHVVTDPTSRQTVADSDVDVVDVVDVVECAEAIAEARTGETVEVGPRDLAYVIYTSGSTGRPKGVAVEHGALSNFLLAMQRRPGFGDDDSILAVTTISFDISMLEIFLPLITGGRVVMAAEEEVAHGRRLAETLERQEVTVMQATPATWRMLLDAGWEGDPGLKVLCGGEAFPRDLADRLLPVCSSVWNMYGPTETTVWSTVGRVRADDPSVPVGSPIDNTRVYVVDDAMNLAPDGVRGELFIGGAGVARGYLDRPELTAERFVPDHFSGDGDARLYRTGDVALWLPDGRLECLGRVDHQVKVRGFRIEPGEIETALLEETDVRDAVVVSAEFGPGDVRLVAHVVAGSEIEPMPSELRSALRRRLPDYMIPNIFQFVDRLPLNPSGKVDRNALPDPRGFATRTSSSRAPETETEKMVASVWEQVLGVDGVRVEDNFFDLGGHSLLAMQVTAKMDKRRSVSVNPMKLAFLNLGQLAAEYDAVAGSAAPSPEGG